MSYYLKKYLPSGSNGSSSCSSTVTSSNGFALAIIDIRFLKLKKKMLWSCGEEKNKDPIWHSEIKRKWISFCHIMKKNELLLKVIYKLQFMIYKCLYLLLAFAIEARQITVRIL